MDLSLAIHAVMGIAVASGVVGLVYAITCLYRGIEPTPRRCAMAVAPVWIGFLVGSILILIDLSQ